MSSFESLVVEVEDLFAVEDDFVDVEWDWDVVGADGWREDVRLEVVEVLEVD